MIRNQILWLTMAIGTSMIAAQALAFPFIPNSPSVSERPHAGKVQKISSDAETEYWQQVREADAAEAYGAYLKVFPSGRYADEARQRLQQLKDGGSAAGATSGGDQNDPESLFWTAMGADHANRIDEALDLYRRAADMNHPKAAGAAGIMLWRRYKHGDAIPWLERAANEHGDPIPMVILGHIYKAGIGGARQDLRAALRWFEKSLNYGDTGVHNEINDLRARLGLR